MLRDRFSHEITLELKDITITSVEDKFLQNTMIIIEEHMDDDEFEVRKFTG